MKDQSIREMRFGEEGFGLLIADLESKTVHISNFNTDHYPMRFLKATTQNFGEFVVECNLIISNQSDLMKVMNEGLLIFNGHFDGTF